MLWPRKLAIALLHAALRIAPPASREWASAMLSELDFIPGDCHALFWSLGSTFAILRHAALNWRQWFAWFAQNREERMNSNGRKAIGVASGALSALALAGCAFALLRIVDILFPQLRIAQTEWTHWLTIIVIPEIIFVAAAIVLWRKRGPIAAGVALVAVAVGLHFVIHIVSH